MPSALMLRLIGVVVVLLALYGLYWSVDHQGYVRGRDEVQARWDKAAADQAGKEVAQSGAASKRLEEGNAKQKVVYRTITQTVDGIVERPVYRNVCLDSTGVCLANAALSGTPADTCESDYTLRKPGPAH